MSKKKRKLEKRENTTASLIENDSLRDREDGLIIEDEDESKEVEKMLNDSIDDEHQGVES